MKKPEKSDYMGDDKGVCPYCHSNLLLAGDTPVVSCPLCDISGDLIVEGNRIKINWREEDLEKVRWEPAGMGYHVGKIKENHAHFEQNREKVKERLPKYRDYKTYARP